MRLLKLFLGLVFVAIVTTILYAQIKVANTDADLDGRILMVADSATGRTVTNLFTYDRDPNPPFAVTASSAKVTNLDGDLLDGLTSARFTWTVVTTTSTGTQNDFDPGIVAGPMVVRANNASLLTITGFLSTNAYDGQPLVLVSIGAGQVGLDHQDVGSAAAGRLINLATSANTLLAAGSGTARYVYDSTTARWRLLTHEQGAWITPTFAAGNYTGNVAMTWTVAAGDVTTQAFWLKGRMLTVTFYVASTTVGGTPNTSLQIGNGTWGGFTITKTMLTPIYLSDNGTTGHGFVQTTAGAIVLGCNRLASANWSAATDATSVFGTATFEVD